MYDLFQDFSLSFIVNWNVDFYVVELYDIFERRLGLDWLKIEDHGLGLRFNLNLRVWLIIFCLSCLTWNRS